MPDISIFAKEAFLNTSPNTSFISKEESYHGRGHLQRVSSIIRGDQIAEKIGAQVNPSAEEVGDVCIFVKPHVKKGMDIEFISGSRNYIDIIDGHNLGQLAKKHPEVGVIVCSQADYEVMSKELPNKIVLIPQHHCNFERVKRTRKEIKRVGIIGEKNAFAHLPEDLEEELSKRGMELVKFSKFFSRQDIIDFYLSIDLQIVWRPYKKRLSNPLKIVNAMSFGVPTIALDEKAFKEVGGCYMPVNDFDEFLFQLDQIREKDWLYQTISNTGIEKAEDYHVDNVAELYRRLDTI